MHFGVKTKLVAREVQAHFGIVGHFESLCAVARMAREYNTLQEHRCNQGLTERQETREGNIELYIREIVEPLGLKVQFSGDPRGYTVTLLRDPKSMGLT